MGFQGYYMKIGDCTFQNPSFKREGFKYAPRLIETADATTTANGALSIKVLSHVRKKIWCSFPPMTPEQFRTYWNALRGNESGPTMHLSVTVFNDSINDYETDTFYHTDLIYTPIIYKGERMIQIDDFELIGH